MRIVYNYDKDQANVAKHGISLSQAEYLNWEQLLIQEDVRRDYGERRWIGYAPIGARLYCVVFTQRNEALRIISLRKANNREQRTYLSCWPGGDAAD